MLGVRILLILSWIVFFLKNWRNFDFYEHFIKTFHIRKVKCLTLTISLFLYEISWWNVHKSQSFFNLKGKKQFRIEWVGFELGASDLECITLTPTPPRIWWRIPVWFKYITLTLTLTQTLTLLCVRIVNVSTSVWRMELSVGLVALV